MFNSISFSWQFVYRCFPAWTISNTLRTRITRWIFSSSVQFAWLVIYFPFRFLQGWVGPINSNRDDRVSFLVSYFRLIAGIFGWCVRFFWSFWSTCRCFIQMIQHFGSWVVYFGDSLKRHWKHSFHFDFEYRIGSCHFASYWSQCWYLQERATPYISWKWLCSAIIFDFSSRFEYPVSRLFNWLHLSLWAVLRFLVFWFCVSQWIPLCTFVPWLQIEYNNW